MKKYAEFLNESREVLKNRHSRYKTDEYVKIKGTEKVGIITFIERYSTGASFYSVYYVKFNNEEKSLKYKAKDLQKATQEDIELSNAINKYNL
jgi:hypothetical protein